VHLALVPDVGVGNDGRDLSPLEQWELYMRGAGRSNRTISETIGVMRRLENYAGYRLESVGPLDIARFLGGSMPNQNSRAAYFGYIHSFYRWWDENGGRNTARPT
jgi:integrase/recombinase XerD